MLTSKTANDYRLSVTSYRGLRCFSARSKSRRDPILVRRLDRYWKDTLMPHGKICYLEIPANRAEDSARFYSDIFGWKVRERGDGNLAFDDTGGVSGTWVKEGDRTPDERTRTYIMVDSITESLKRIERAGGKVVTPRTDIGPGMGAFAAFTDPVGNEFGLYEEPNR